MKLVTVLVPKRRAGHGADGVGHQGLPGPRQAVVADQARLLRHADQRAEGVEQHHEQKDQDERQHRQRQGSDEVQLAQASARSTAARTTTSWASVNSVMSIESFTNGEAITCSPR